MAPYEEKEVERFHNLVDITRRENARVIENQKQGKDLDKPVMPDGTFTINSLAEQWYRCKMRDPFGRSRF